MEKFQLFLLIVQIIVATLMIICILLQKSGSDSLGGIGGSSSSMNPVLSSKASANALTKITMVLIAIFFINCLLSAVVSKNKKSITSEINEISKENAPKESAKNPVIPPIE